MNLPRATIDFETRSAANLKKVGTWRYSVDPTTEILCLAFRLPYWEPGRTALWHPAFRNLGIDEADCWDDIEELVEWIRHGGLIEAHNVFFEYCIWNNILRPRYDWPGIGLSQWRCSAAKAASYALPRGLDDAILALRITVRKDTRKTETEGVRVLKAVHVSKKTRSPRKSRKAERLVWEKSGTTPPSILWHESRELFDALWAYCRQDVLAEEALSEALEDLNDHETEIFLLDLAMNARGFQLDPEAVATALRLLDYEMRLLNQELSDVTDGYVDKASQRENMKLWFATEGLDLADTKGETLDALLSPKSHVRLSPRARRALELMRALGRSSTAKYLAMANWLDPADGRVRGGLLYHGASTGRWSGKGVQPHNFPKLSPKPVDQEKPDPQDISVLWDALMTKTRDYIAKRWKGVMEALSAALRGAIVAPKGKTLYVADFAGIEARVLLWCAGDEAGLQLFRDHADIYCDMAGDIYKRPITKADAKERGIGKIAILGLGYQMGPSKFVDTCEKGGVSIAEDLYCETCGLGSREHRKANHPFDCDNEDEMTAVKVVDAYRTKYWRVKQMWYDQEACAIAAIQTRAPVQCGPVKWIYRAPFLFCELPSGRRLAYCYPKVTSTQSPWGPMKDVLSYFGVDAKTHQWKRQNAYGGLLTENIVQAISRDLMADGILRAEATGVYRVVLTVHDELIAEADEGTGSVQEFEHLMSTLPDWAAGCPVEAEGWSGARYRK